MKVKIKILAYILITFSFILSSTHSYAQIFPPIKHNYIKLSRFSNSFNIVYKLDSFKFYIKRQILIKFLKEQLRTQSDSVIINSLNDLYTKNKTSLIINGGHFIFNLKTGLLNKNETQNDYLLAMNKVLSSIILKGKVAIYDCEKHLFIKSIRVKQEQFSDAKGYLEILEFFDTSKKIIYSMQFRKSEDGVNR